MDEKEIEQYLVDFDKKELPLAIERELFVHSETQKIKTIIGPRRAGKTFFLFQVIKKLKKNGEKVLFLNFESPKLFGITFKEIRKIVSLYERIFPSEKNKKPSLFFDEPQNVDLWEKAIRELYEEGYNIYLSGSSSKLLSKEIATSLRGRSISYLLLPFSFKEFLRSKNFFYSNNLSSEEKNKLLVFLREYLDFGGFPEILLEENKDLKMKYLENYFDLVVYKDMIERHNIKDSFLIKWFLKSLVSSFSNELSIHKIYLTLKSQGRKISKDEIYTYKSITEDSFFAFYLPKFSYSLRKREGLSKVYLVDPVFVKLIETSEDLGKKMENLVFLELLRRKKPFEEFFYWKNNQKEEVDFVVKEKNSIKALIQVVKEFSKEETKEREARALLKASRDLKCKNLIMITENFEGREKFNWFDFEGEIRFVPLWKWLLEDFDFS